jgi:hypothetical protein
MSAILIIGITCRNSGFGVVLEIKSSAMRPSIRSANGSQQIPSDFERLFNKGNTYKRLAPTPEGRPIPTPELTVIYEIVQAIRSGTSIKYEGNQPCNA